MLDGGGVARSPLIPCFPPRFHALLRRVPDAEIARRAGWSESAVLAAKRKLGIPALQGRRELGCALRGECQPH